MNRRIVFFANTSWYLWNFRVRLAERLVAEGHEIVFCAPVDEYSRRLSVLGRFVALPMDRKGRNPFRELLVVARVGRMLRRERPDVVLAWTPKPNIYGAISGRLARTPVVPNVAGLGFAFIGGRRLARVAGLLYRIAFHKCSVVFFQNSHDRDQFILAGWVSEAEARMLPGSGVDLDRFRPLPVRGGDDFVFLFVGRLLGDKGLRELAAATRALKAEGADVHLKIAGFVDSGNPAAVGEAEIRQWEAEGIVEYLGRTDEPESLIADSDCVVLPSYYREGVPRALLEAAACARPVITTDAAGCRDAVIDGETGFLCEPRDAESLAAAMRRMMALAPAERAQMGKAGRAFMESSFSEEIVFEAYLRALRDVLGEAPAARTSTEA